RFGGAGQTAQMLQDDVADRTQIQRSTQRLTESHEMLQIRRSFLSFATLGLGKRRTSPSLLTLPVLLEEKYDRQDDERQEQGDAGCLLDVAGEIDERPYLPGEDQQHGHRQPEDEGSVGAADPIHPFEL